MLKNESLPITLVDLDTVEPAYTLRPLKKKLETFGLSVLTREDYTGLGETGNIITAEQKNCLYREGNIVIDVGYGAGGLDILDIIPNIEKEENLEIYIVINASKFETSTVENIIEYINWGLGKTEQKWKKFKGIISNTHFGNETTIEDIIKGYELTKTAAGKVNLPVRALSVDEKFHSQIKELIQDETPIWSLKRFMPEALW